MEGFYVHQEEDRRFFQVTNLIMHLRRHNGPFKFKFEGKALGTKQQKLT